MNLPVLILVIYQGWDGINLIISIIQLKKGKKIDLAKLPGFDMSKIGEVTGGTRSDGDMVLLLH